MLTCRTSAKSKPTGCGICLHRQLKTRRTQHLKLRFGSNFELIFSVQFTKQNGYGFLYSGAPGGFYAGKGNQIIRDVKFDYQPITQSNTEVIRQGSLFQSSSGVIVDASYIRLRNAGIYYTIPHVTKAIKRGKVFIQGQNLLTFSTYRGFDPENPSSAIVIPPLRTIAGGIQFTF